MSYRLIDRINEGFQILFQCEHGNLIAFLSLPTRSRLNDLL
jgi:hypothetical protein